MISWRQSRAEPRSAEIKRSCIPGRGIGMVATVDATDIQRDIVVGNMGQSTNSRKGRIEPADRDESRTTSKVVP